MRISDWSADVCSSDLSGDEIGGERLARAEHDIGGIVADQPRRNLELLGKRDLAVGIEQRDHAGEIGGQPGGSVGRWRHGRCWWGSGRRLARHRPLPARHTAPQFARKTGRASCRDIVCQLVYLTDSADPFTQNTALTHITPHPHTTYLNTPTTHTIFPTPHPYSTHK